MKDLFPCSPWVLPEPSLAALSGGFFMPNGLAAESVRYFPDTAIYEPCAVYSCCWPSGMFYWYIELLM